MMKTVRTRIRLAIVMVVPFSVIQILLTTTYVVSASSMIIAKSSSNQQHVEAEPTYVESIDVAKNCNG